MALIRLIVMLLIIQTVIFVCLQLYSRSRCRSRLEEEWAETAGPVTDADAREAFIQRGMADYDGSLRKKLIWGVYIIPFVLIALLVYVTNFM
jgi:hypothetical protein